ncbi:MAG: hypothetical protein AB7F59_11995 [Bdellovibrionales bacterium]
MAMQLVQAILSTAFITASCFCASYLWLRTYKFHHFWEELCFRYALGLGIHCSGIFVLGLLHLIHPVSLLLWTFLPFAILVISDTDHKNFLMVFGSWIHRHGRFLTLLVIAALPWFSLALYPAFGWDEVAIHLSSARSI